MNKAESQLQSFWRRANLLASTMVLVGAVALLIAAPHGEALAMGLLLGGISSIARYRLTYRALRRGDRSGLVRTRMLNYALSAAVLAVAFVWSDAFSPWTAAPGLLAMNVALILTDLLRREENVSTQAVGDEP